jgi:hypothetical protein
VHPLGRTARGADQEKIDTLRADARRDKGVAAACVLEALNVDLNTEDSIRVLAQATVGGLLISEIREELTTIRKLLMAVFKK